MHPTQNTKITIATGLSHAENSSRKKYEIIQHVNTSQSLSSYEV